MLLGTGTVAALGVARVGSAAGDLVVAVDAGVGSGTPHGVLVEPYVDEARNGFRVHQDQLGRPTITTSDADCLANPAFNDVVCNGGRRSLSVVMRGGADRVILHMQEPHLANCISPGGTEAVLGADVTLGDGDDVFSVDGQVCGPGFAPFANVVWRVTVDGGPGLDTLFGGPLDDTLLGGPDNNDLKGRGGNDLLRGGDQRDQLDGDAGNDTLRGGDGLDAFNGGDGDDLFHGGLNGAGPDVFVGGAGVDTVTYGLAGSGVTVTVFDPTSPNASQAFDGQAGENDSVQGDVENVTGSGHADRITGNNLANRIDGSLGDDTIAGAAGADTLLGGDGNDAINSRDAERDPLIDCGPGAADSATIDLVDQGSRGKPNPVNCETVFAFASDDGPPGRLATAVLRPDGTGVALVRLVCPRAARVTCRGVLTLRRAAGAPVLRRVAYAVPRGTGDDLAIRVPASLGGRAAVLQTLERGVSRKGPRGVTRLLRVAAR